MKNLKFIFVLFVISISCKKESNTIEETPIPTDKVPIVMMHGVLAAGDTYEQQFLRFTSNGYDPRVVYVFDWNSKMRVGQQKLPTMCILEAVELLNQLGQMPHRFLPW
ncbi:MAG: hypothetical protein IPH74_05205 [Bacteroidetes bacterium]|nr:hypothetical protein [Bacteroidota bacterium]